MSHSKSLEMTSPQGRHFLLSADLWIPLVLLALGTVLFNRYNWDMQIQAKVYDGSWYLGNVGWARVLYHYGNIPALLVAVGAVLVFFLSYRRIKLLPYRKLSAYLVLAMVVGPGLIVNSLLKDNWGRPRPRDVVEFGGKYAYEAPLRIDPASSGKSFPCGHATMGFYFFAVGFVLRSIKSRWSEVMHVWGLSFGLMIGAARILQGGHFSSDVIWAGGLIYLVSFLLWRIMRLDTQPMFSGEIKSKPRLGSFQTMGLVLVGVLLILGVSLATPYSSKREFTPDSRAGGGFELKLVEADLTLTFGDQSHIKTDVSGFGFPGSKVRFNRQVGDKVWRLEQNLKGYFTELSCRVSAQIDTTLEGNYQVVLERGEVNLLVPQHRADILYVNPDCIIGTNDSALVFKQIDQNVRSGIRIESTNINILSH